MAKGVYTMATTHPDYATPRLTRLTALGARTYESGEGWVVSVTMEPRGGKGKARYADVIMKPHSGATVTHTVRVWRHGPISLLDCDQGSINGQDTMRLFGAATDCPGCMALVQHVRAHRGWSDAQWVIPGNGYGFATMRTVFRDQFMQQGVDGTWNWEEKGKARAYRDRDRTSFMDSRPVRGDYAARVAGTIGSMLNGVRPFHLAGFDIRGSMSTGYSASATCYKRGWGKGNKRLSLTVPPSWLKVLWDCGGVLDGYLVGATLSQTATTRECWAIKPLSPVDQTTWWRARYQRNEAGAWKFKSFVRNGAMGAGGGK
jgi:hypothetical protein